MDDRSKQKDPSRTPHSLSNLCFKYILLVSVIKQRLSVFIIIIPFSHPPYVLNSTLFHTCYPIPHVLSYFLHLKCVKNVVFFVHFLIKYKGICIFRIPKGFVFKSLQVFKIGSDFNNTDFVGI